MRVSSTVPPRYRQHTLVAYLAARFTYWDAARWQALIAAGQVWLNGAPAHAGSPVAPGDVVACELPDLTPTQAIAVDVLYADETLLAVNKPGGVRVHAHGRFVVDSLIHYLRHRHAPPYPDATLVHRLDAGTSGVLLLARGAAAAAALGAQFSSQTVEKAYLAVVHGIPAHDAGTIDLPLGPAPGSRLRYRQAVVRGDEGKTAVTHYRLVRRLGAQHALLALQPRTGRTHQLRVHLAAIGYPIVGDALYTMDDDAFLAWTAARTPTPAMHDMRRQALHCWQIRCRHPVGERPFTFTAPLPPDITALVERLQSNSCDS
ncbi:MAG: RluA family pseudouridine synthase [Anaerolineales bacterium]|nr:RluA family pseudouridine synthase [Anaerolineales bacterium]